MAHGPRMKNESRFARQFQVPFFSGLRFMAAGIACCGTSMVFGQPSYERNLGWSTVAVRNKAGYYSSAQYSMAIISIMRCCSTICGRGYSGGMDVT